MEARCARGLGCSRSAPLPALWRLGLRELLVRPEHRDWIAAEERVGPEEHLVRDLARGAAVAVFGLAALGVIWALGW